ncbi:hypothetical protein C4K23_2513 [Pseudomonas chlororaphis]|nr:hypothetical protein C4K23_2513 [Pseudomonas chlororaphis]
MQTPSTPRDPDPMSRGTVIAYAIGLPLRVRWRLFPGLW